MKIALIMSLAVMLANQAFAEIGLTYGILNRGLYIDVPIQKTVPRSLGVVIGTQSGGAALRYERAYDEIIRVSHSLYTTKSRRGVFYAGALAITLEFPYINNSVIVYCVEAGLRTAPIEPAVNLRIGWAWSR